MHDDQALSQDALGVGPSASNRANAGQHDRPSIFRGFRRLLLRVPEPLTSPSRSGKNFSTFLVSLQVIIVPLFILVQKMGMVNTYAGSIIPVTFNAFGIFLLRQFYLGIPIDLQEAAIIDGASYWGIYWNIMLPLSRPILSALAVFFFLVNWNAFLWPLTITTNQNRTTCDSKFPKSIFRRLELYYGGIGGGRGANACTLLRVPTLVGRINQDFRH